MTFPEHLRCRRAGAGDADRVAALHADSWRRHYRGAYSDSFLDGDVLADRTATWRARLGEPGPGSATVLAESGDGGLLGFAHVIFDADPTWGALLENLHVSNAQRGRGIGSRLISLVAEAVRDRSTGLYLWVLERNTAARAFYQAHGGHNVESGDVPAPGGDPSRLAGTPTRLRYAWPDPTVLLPGR